MATPSEIARDWAKRHVLQAGEAAEALYALARPAHTDASRAGPPIPEGAPGAEAPARRGKSRPGR